MLTAAHCTHNKGPKDFVAVMGDHDWDSNDNADTMDVECVKNHMSYDPILMDFDIAMLTLSKKVDFGSGKRPACLPRTTNFKDRGMKDRLFTASGWGSKRTQDGYPISLNSVDLEYVKWHDCRRINKWKQRKISWRTFCSADGPNEDVCSCSGDGGGTELYNHNCCLRRSTNISNKLYCYNSLHLICRFFH